VLPPLFDTRCLHLLTSHLELMTDHGGRQANPLVKLIPHSTLKCIYGVINFDRTRSEDISMNVARRFDRVYRRSSGLGEPAA
jgi:hypothetical protein